VVIFEFLGGRNWKAIAHYLELVFLCPVNLIRGVVRGEGFIRLVQALAFPETFCGNISLMSYCTVYTL